MKQLPPLPAIRAFEAAARHQNFTRAGEELGLTQAAISYKIRQLEDRVGQPLFRRHGRRVELTDAGRCLLPEVSGAFSTLERAFAAIDPIQDKTLWIASFQTFSTQWLATRVGHFQIAHPELTVRIFDRLCTQDYAIDSADVSIRVGAPTQEGLAGDYLAPRRYAVAASPALLARHPPVTRVEDVLKLPVNDPEDTEFTHWLSEAGFQGSHTHLPRVRLGSQTYEAQMVLAGQGIAALDTWLFRDAFASGQVVKLLDLEVEDPKGYWLAYPERLRKAPKLRAFRDWMLEQRQQEEA